MTRPAHRPPAHIPCAHCGEAFPRVNSLGHFSPIKRYCSAECYRRAQCVLTAINRRARRLADVDSVAVERACRGDRNVRLNRAEQRAAFGWLNAHGYSSRQIAARLGVTPRTVVRWRGGYVGMPSTERKSA